MHCLEVIIKRNQEAAERELASARLQETKDFLRRFLASTDYDRDERDARALLARLEG